LRWVLRATEDGLDLLVRILEAGVGVGLVGRLDDHVLRVLVPVLAELGAAHADDGDLVANGLWVHGATKLRSDAGNCKASRRLTQDGRRSEAKGERARAASAATTDEA